MQVDDDRPVLNQLVSQGVHFTFKLGVLFSAGWINSQGIIHRDLKPENIFITKDERIKILDFGLAKRFYSNELEGRSSFETLPMDTEAGTVLGTVPYMSPEQARGENVDPKSDIFSTGIMLYELLTGRLPFEGPSPASIIHKIIYEDCAPATTLRADLPKWIDPVLQRALAKEKDSRYSSTAELLDELKKHQDRSIASTRPMPLQTVGRGLRPASAIPAVILVLALSVLAVWFFNRQAKVRWAREQALPQIEGMIANSWRDSTEAYKLAEEAEQYIPNDPALANLFSKISLKINVTTEPSGAKIYLKQYSTPDIEWKYVGESPIEQLRVPLGIFRWKIEKEGYESVLAAATTFDVDIAKESLVAPSNLMRVLDEQQNARPGMVRVSGATTRRGKIVDFYIDRYEVTNKEYKNFVDNAGYRKKEYWKNDFRELETVLTWEQAMGRFVDQTGRPGPAEWEAETYPEGQGDYPVSGISWYEAAAYAEFAGKSLPTETHWGLATGASTPLLTYPQLGGFAVFAPFSNFLGKGPVSVGSLPGITPFGTYDMAGNVREWCWNETPKGRLIRGGAWGDNTYTFGNLSQAPPMDRSVKNGFRCALYPDSAKIPPVAFEALELAEAIDYYREKPVPDSVFQVYKEQFSYDETPLNAKVESKKESSEGWVQEKITFDADPSRPDDSHLSRDYQIQLVKDFRRSVDYLVSRPDVASNTYETSSKPLFDLLGTPKDQKELKLYETDHIPPRTEFIKETLVWLDRYLGPVNR